MTNKKFWLGILVIALVFGMTVVGCETEPEPEPKKEKPYLSGIIVELDNYYPVVGETITASFKEFSSDDDDDPIGTPSWKWYKTAENTLLSTDKTSIGYSSTYTVKQSDVGFWLWAEVSYSGNRGTKNQRTSSTAIGIPATASVSVSMTATYYLSRSGDNHSVTVTLTLSDGRWNKVDYSTASQWLTMSGIPYLISWYPDSYRTPSVSASGRDLTFFYWTKSDTTLPIINLTATLNTDELSTMRSNTNVYNTLTAGTPATVSVSQWKVSQY